MTPDAGFWMDQLGIEKKDKVINSSFLGEATNAIKKLRAL